MLLDLSSDQSEAFDYLLYAKLGFTIGQHDWIRRMKSALWSQGFLTDRQIKVVENIAQTAGVEINGHELFARMP